MAQRGNGALVYGHSSAMALAHRGVMAQWRDGARALRQKLLTIKFLTIFNQSELTFYLSISWEAVCRQACRVFSSLP